MEKIFEIPRDETKRYYYERDKKEYRMIKINIVVPYATKNTTQMYKYYYWSK
tara:strand:+ start:72 stop:227 length:156 start_codon:yes stop_codon:yes gene_type:complete